MKKNLVFLMLALIACTFGARADELTVANGSATNSNVPISGLYCDNTDTYSQTIYSSTMLADMAGAEISAVKYYLKDSETLNANLKNAVLQLSLKEVSIDAFVNYNSVISGMTAVATYTIAGGESELVFNFTEPFTYSGENNLVIEVKVLTKSGYKTTYWKGEDQTTITSIYRAGSGSTAKFIPKTTFTYENVAPVDYKASVSPNAIDFGKLEPNASASQTITIKNKGTNAITPSLSGISAPFSTDYSSTTINSGEELTFNVTFNPTETGTFNQTLAIDCGFEDGVFNVSLDGTCTKEIVVADGTTTNDKLPVYGFNYDSYNQQNQFVYPASMMTSLVGKKLKSITFYPSAGINFYGGSVTFSLASVAEGSVSFTASGNTPQSPEGLTAVGTITMPATAQATLTEWKLTFAGEGFDYYGGDLLVDVTTMKGSWGRTNFYGTATDDYAGYSCTAASTKEGQKFLPKVMFEYEDAVAQVAVTPNELTFGGESFLIGNAEAKTFKVSNTTTEDANLILNDESGFFSIDVTTVEAGSTNVTVNVTYAPTAAGTHEATVSVGDKIVTLNGTAVDPVISGTVTPTELTFETYENVAATQVITIENTGNTAFTPVFSAIEAPFSIEAATEIAAGESKEFVVTYVPEQIGTHTGALTVTINGAETNVNLTGTATEAPLEITVAENGTAQSQPIPIEGTYLDTEGAYSQTIYNKNDISVLAGNSISKIKYYSATTFDAAKIGGTVLEIYLMETENDEMPIPEGSYSAQPLTFDGVALGEYEIQGGETEMEFALNSPFNYSGSKNLAIQVRVKTKSPQTSGYNYQAINWYGEGTSSSISYAGNVGSYNNGAKAFLPKTTFTFAEDEVAEEVTLAELVAGGKDGETYTISDQLVAVSYYDNLLWCKDQGNASVNKTEIKEGQIDFMKQQGVQTSEWDQSNWIVLEINEADALKLIGEALPDGKPQYIKAKTITGTYNAADCSIELNGKFEVDGEASYTKNVYCTSNFLPANLNLNGGMGATNTGNPGVYYFFMNPKNQEVCTITFAHWNEAGNCFTVPSTSGFEGAISVDYAYNSQTEETVKKVLVDGKAYQFDAVVRCLAGAKGLKDNTPSESFKVYPTNLDGGDGNDVPTAIGIVDINGKTVESVKYVSVAGLESDVPFQGVNIVVTTYTDGSRSSHKIMK